MDPGNYEFSCARGKEQQNDDSHARLLSCPACISVAFSTISLCSCSRVIFSSQLWSAMWWEVGTFLQTFYNRCRMTQSLSNLYITFFCGWFSYKDKQTF